MAKPKQDVMVKVYPPNLVQVWSDDPKRATAEIVDIEGVNMVMGGSGNPIDAFLDLRYDINEVAKEIERLLLSEVPKVFRE